MNSPPVPVYPLELSLTRLRTAWGGFPDGVGDIRSLSAPPWESLVLNGALSGCRLTELAGRHTEAFLGPGMEMDAREPFPLRLRFLSTHRDLPVTVHPHEAYTLLHRLPVVGQEKIWYVVDVKRSGRLYCGWKEPWTGGRLYAAVAEDRVRDLLHRVRVRPGQAFTIPPGRPHAMGAGLTVFEVARHTPAAFTLSRAGYRELPGDIEEILEPEAKRPEAIHGIASALGASRLDHLCFTPRFSLRRFSVSGTLDLSTSEGRFLVLTGIRGFGRLRWGLCAPSCGLQPHQSVLVPACPEDLTLESEEGMEILETSLPDLSRGALEEVMSFGFSRADVAGLGGPDYASVLMGYLQTVRT